MSNQITTLPNNQMGSAMEAVLIDGDLSKLTPEQRVTYYKKTCDSLGLNYLTKPFAYIRLNGKLTFYALKDCTEQLRKRDHVSIYEMKTQSLDGVFVVTAYARTKDGKEDVATGSVPTLNLKGEALANALMKAETKAKRRVTLSICGLGMADEEEIISIPMAQKVNVDLETGEIEYKDKPTQVVTPNALPNAEKTDEQVMAEMKVPRQELIDNIMKCKDMTDLKMQFSRAYVCHQNRMHLMKDIEELKDLQKKKIEDFTKAMTDGTFDDQVPEFITGNA
jgi:hypothetical protein